MKVLLQVNSVFQRGSTGRIVDELGKIATSRGWKSYIAFGRAHNLDSSSALIKIGDKIAFILHVLLTRLFDRHGYGSRRATLRLIRRIEQINPDVIALHNLHGYYINIAALFDFLKEFKKPVFWTLYDCWAFTGHCAYFDLVKCDKWKTICHECPAKHSYPASWASDNSRKNFASKKKIFSGVEDLTLIVHSNWLRQNIQYSFLKDYPVRLIHNGVNLYNFRKVESNKIRDKFNLKGKFIILGIANIWSERKGLYDFIKLSSYLSGNEIIVLDGVNGKERKMVPKNVVVLDRAKSVKELAELYSMADVFFNPTYEDNFPTTNLESLACGTPVITYNTGGSPEAVDRKTGFVVDKGSIEQVYSSIKEVKMNGKDSYGNACIERAKNLFNYKDRYQDYITLFEESVN